jgi:hypothetical protein
MIEMGIVGTWREWPGLRARLRGHTDGQPDHISVSSVEKALLIAERSLAIVGQGAGVTLGRHDFFELDSAPMPPEIAPGLAIRTAGEDDLEGVCAVAETPPRLVLERLRRGDLVYIGVAGGRVTCHAWFHRGPRPFTEDQPHLARWALDETTFWAYGGAAVESRGSAFFVDVFQTALADLFSLHGARRVLCRIRRTNAIAALLHERLGFRRIGCIAGVGTPWLRSLVWLGPPTRTFILGPNSATTVDIPPGR